MFKPDEALERREKSGASRPRVAIGLPVYNGSRFLREALDSILAQTLADFELIISDNASTDSTEQICREYAAKDSRIRYHRLDRNIGISRNFNRTFELSDSEYFKWIAHDDITAPTFVEVCVKALDNHPEAMMAYPQAKDIDADGVTFQERNWDLHPGAEQPSERLRYFICIEHSCFQIFGLFRSDWLRRTELQGPYPGSDRVLLAEAALAGPLLEIPEKLYWHREHDDRAAHVSSYQHMLVLYEPGQATRLSFPWFRLLKEYIRAIGRSPLGGGGKFRSYLELLRWLRWHWRDLLSDLWFYATHVGRFKSEKA